MYTCIHSYAICVFIIVIKLKNWRSKMELTLEIIAKTDDYFYNIVSLQKYMKI